MECKASSTIWALATIVPSLALSVRRLHDTNKAGTTLVILYAIDFIGGVLLSVGLVMTGLGAISVISGGSSSTGAAGILLLIIGFSYFYATMQFNPIEVANNLKKNGGFIPGFRPGKPTADFITKVLNKITMFGALYLSVIAIAPIITGNLVGYSSLAIGGTSVIIVVGVALETVKQLEAQMLMRHYKGFLE